MRQRIARPAALDPRPIRSRRIFSCGKALLLTLSLVIAGAAPAAGAVIRDQGWPALLTIFVIISAIALSFAPAFLIAEHNASSPHR